MKTPRLVRGVFLSEENSQNTVDPCTDRSHALRGNAARDAPRHWTRSVPRGIPTRSVGTIKLRTLKMKLLS